MADLKLSESMREALKNLPRHGWQVIGFVPIWSPTARALERRGLVEIWIIDDGWFGWNNIKLTSAGRKLRATL